MNKKTTKPKPSDGVSDDVPTQKASVKKSTPKKVSVKLPDGVSLSVIEAQLKEQYGDDVIMLIED